MRSLVPDACPRASTWRSAWPAVTVGVLLAAAMPRPGARRRGDGARSTAPRWPRRSPSPPRRSSTTASPKACSRRWRSCASATPGLLSIGLRGSDGELLIDDERACGALAAAALKARRPTPRSSCRCGRPVSHGAARTALRAAARRRLARPPAGPEPAPVGFRLRRVRLLFLGYLKRMLRELDPSRSVPQRVRAAYDTLTEGLLVLDRNGAIVLANTLDQRTARRRRRRSWSDARLPPSVGATPTAARWRASSCRGSRRWRAGRRSATCT